GPRMAHAAPRRRCRTRNETSDGLPAVDSYPGSGFLLRRTANFTNHYDAVRVRVGVEQLDHVQVRGAVDRVPANADASGLAHAAASELPDGLVGQRAAARYHADVTLLVDVTGRNPNAAATLRIFARAGRDNARTIGPDESRPAAFRRPLHLHHVVDWDAFGDADHQLQAGFHPFEDRVGRKGRGHKNGRCRRPGLLHGLGHGVEDRNLVLEQLTALARRNAGDDLGAVSEAQLCVPCAEASSNTLDQDAGLWGDEDGHELRE